MLFDVTFPDGTVRTMQAHNREQLERALQHVSFSKIEEGTTLGCHGPSVQCLDHTVERLDSVTAVMTVHNIYEMHSDGRLMGFIKDAKGIRYTVMKAPVWDKWYEQKP